MFLSSLILNPRSKAARRDMHDVYEMHRTLMSALPGKDDGGAGLMLWRLDTDRRSGISRVLVQSEKSPDWGKVTTSSPDYLATDCPEGILPMQTKPLPELHFQNGQLLVFRLRANPTVKREGKRHGLLTEDEQTAWLNRKAESHGFRLASLTVTPEQAAESSNGNGRRLKFVSALFEGRLIVTQPEDFRVKTLASGIGSAKAFGFGLLSVARV
tara:strand:- start:57960 stop:58598 length:639 start_codon:yes stop_codon:yes gene_type:complete